MAPATPTSAQWVNETNTLGIAFPCNGPYTEAPAQKPHKLSLAARQNLPGSGKNRVVRPAPRRSPFSSEVCGDFPDGPRPLSSHQFSPLGDLPRWDFEVLTLGVVVVGGGVRKYQGLWSARTPAPGIVQHWKGGNRR